VLPNTRLPYNPILRVLSHNIVVQSEFSRVEEFLAGFWRQYMTRKQKYPIEQTLKEVGQ